MNETPVGKEQRTVNGQTEGTVITEEQSILQWLETQQDELILACRACEQAIFFALRDGLKHNKELLQGRMEQARVAVANAEKGRSK